MPQYLPQKCLEPFRRRIAEEISRIVLFDDTALVHKDYAVRDLAGEAHFMGDA